MDNTHLSQEELLGGCMFQVTSTDCAHTRSPDGHLLLWYPDALPVAMALTLIYFTSLLRYQVNIETLP